MDRKPDNDKKYRPILICAVSLALAIPILIGFLILWQRIPANSLLEGIPFGAEVLDAKGGLLKIGLSADEKYRLKTDLDRVSPEAVKATLHYEDRYFYSHPGVNPFALFRAAVSFLSPGARQVGASTITMQVARLRFRLKTSDILGKLEQIALALLIELKYDKEEILEAYFNLAPYGGNIEGVEAAARVYFDKPASALTALECRGLAVTPQNPGARNPVSGKDFARASRRLGESMERTNGAPTLAAGALKVRAPGQIPVLAPHLSAEMLAQKREGEIRSAIERDLQATLEKTLSGFVSRGKNYGIVNAAAIILNSDDMRVAAIAGSANFNSGAIQGQVDGTRARRSPGSTLKPFIYGLALDQGLIHPLSILPDSPRSFGGYDPGNFDGGFRGPVSASEALKSSRNLPAITLAEQLRQPGLYGFLREAGVNLPKGPEYYGLALALGGAELSMRELCAAYAMLANQGLWRPLRFEDAEPISPPKRLLSPEAAWLVLKMLERPEAQIQSNGKTVFLRYKTGTSNGMRDAWTAGIVGSYVIVVWVGNFDNSANPCFVGAQTALPLFQELANSLAAMRDLEERVNSAETGLNLIPVQACADTGDINFGVCERTEPTWLIAAAPAIKNGDILRRILVDKETGMRACSPVAGKTEEIWQEFWPSEMLAIFASAGINKPKPPEWLPECQKRAPSPAGKAPRVILPKKNVIYRRELSGESFALPLLASGDGEADKIHWYADGTYLGSAKPGETIFWRPSVSGKIRLLAVDNFGRSSRRDCEILAPRRR